jgi:hypothetical protein
MHWLLRQHKRPPLLRREEGGIPAEAGEVSKLFQGQAGLKEIEGKKALGTRLKNNMW